jgi:DNA polymerase III sliding clamp (beta) subunit (PCNA family)
MTIKCNAAEMKKITDAKISFKGLSPQINFLIREDKIFIGVDNGFQKVIGVIKVESVVDKDIVFSLPYNTLNFVLASFGNKDITIEYNSKRIVFRSDKANINLIPMSDVTDILDTSMNFKADNTAEIDLETFKTVMKKVVPFIAHDNIKPILRFINVNFNKDNINFHATDGKKMSHYILASKSITFTGEPCIVNMDTDAIKKVLAEATTAVKMQWNSNSILFEYDNIRMISQFAEGKYPDMSKILSLGYKYQTSINREDLIEAMKTVSALLKGNIMEARATQRISFHFDKSEIKVFTSSDAGSGEFSLSHEGNIEDHNMSVNCEYLLTILNEIDTPNAVFQMTDDMTPIKVMGQENADKTFFVFMPLREQE